MTDEKIQTTVSRSVIYNTFSDKLQFTANVRVILKSPGRSKDLALVRIRADSPANLNAKIAKLKAQFRKLLTDNRDFIKSIGEPDIFDLDAED